VSHKRNKGGQTGGQRKATQFFLRIKAVRGLVLGWVSIHFLCVTFVKQITKYNIIKRAVFSEFFKVEQGA